MADPYVGEIRIFAGVNAPPGGAVRWALCQGQLLKTADFPGLFRVLGYTYGGGGATFALPNLQGAMPIQAGQGPNLTDRPLGGSGGAQSVQLSMQELALHTHKVNANAGEGTLAVPGNAVWSTSTFQRGQQALYSATQNAAMNANATAPTGGSAAHENMMPYLVLNFIIALDGILPEAAEGN